MYIGFGSPGVPRPAEVLQVVLRLQRQTGLRLVLSFPTQTLAGADLPPSIFPLQAVPHAWLFPRCAACLHHGGAGTTAAGVLAGIPAVIAPLASDQFYWGERLAALGVAPTPIPQRSLSADKLAQALQLVFFDPSFGENARQLAQTVRREDGVGAAVELIRRLV